MTTLGELIDRTLRDWLEPADDQPTRLVLAETIDEDDLTGISYDADLIGPEELEILGPGTLVEMGSEEALIASIDESASTIDFSARGVNGTVPADHDAGSFIYPHRVWRRRVLFDVLCDGVVGLYPDVYRTPVSASLAVASTTYTEVPDAVIDDGIVGVRYFLGVPSGGTLYDQFPVRFINPAPMVSNGKAIVVSGLGTGATGYLAYKAKFLRPSDEDDDLTEDFGVLPEYERIVMLEAVAYLVAGRELDIATQERLSEQLEQQGYQAGTPSQIRDSLLRYRAVLIDRAQNALRVEVPVAISMMEPF